MKRNNIHIQDDYPEPPTPEEVVSAARPSRETIALINLRLREPVWSDWEKRQGRTISTSLIGGVDHLGFIKAFYKKYRWQVEHCSDQREGDFLRFKPELQ